MNSGSKHKQTTCSAEKVGPERNSLIIGHHQVSVSSKWQSLKTSHANQAAAHIVHTKRLGLDHRADTQRSRRNICQVKSHLSRQERVAIIKAIKASAREYMNAEPDPTGSAWRLQVIYGANRSLSSFTLGRLHDLLHAASVCHRGRSSGGGGGSWFDRFTGQQCGCRPCWREAGRSQQEKEPRWQQETEHDSAPSV